MTFKYQSPFKQGEVPQILKKLHDSELRRHAEQIATRDSIRALFGEDCFTDEGTVDAASESRCAEFDDLSFLLDEAPATPYTELHSNFDKPPELEIGLSAGEHAPSSRESHSEDIKTAPLDLLCPQQDNPVQANHVEAGVNTKKGRSNRATRMFSTPGRAGLVAGFYFGHAERVVAISKLHTDLDHDQLEKLLKTDAFIQKLIQSYQGIGKLPDWAKFVSPEMKQFFRLFQLCTKPNAKTITIRLDHQTAEAALAAPRGPANYLAAIIKRTLAKLGIETDLAFNLEFNHTGRTENHPAHIHGALCVPGDRIGDVTEALRCALAEGYRQRYRNLAVHIEVPHRPHWWASYCVKEYGITAIKLSSDRVRKTRPDYATQSITQEAKAFYEGINTWLEV
ncbi:hypothetical protein [Pseudomonas helleri]|uniref:hypothetical protein n=1 Tax=Pseudomonas helleri TaxID=1608996 RepID=UPI003FD32F26